MKTLQNRLLSFGLIGSLGFLLLVSLAATTLVEGMGDRLKSYFPNVTVVVFYIVNLVLTLGVTTALFGIIFKVLPDAKIKWKDIWPGAVATSLLFLLGKFAISLYISKSEVGSTYGAAGSLAVILVWIYYSSIILYFGAEFTKSYAFNKGAKIVPNHYAEWNREPAVPGADPKQPPANATAEEKHEDTSKPAPAKVQAPVIFQPALKPSKIEAKKSPGLGTVVFGLVLYFINSRKDKKTVSLKASK
jgi:membrane protein